MLRGTIEEVRRDGISGWLYADDVPVRGQLVLAFLDDACVGSGRISEHRPDLEAAGLGDGYLGFQFPIAVSAADAGRIVVKLERSDAFILQRGAKVVRPDSASAGPLTKEQADQLISSYKWMLSKGWLRQMDYDYLKSLAKFGVYERTLVTKSGDGDARIGDAREMTESMLSLLMQSAVEVTESRPASADHLRDLIQDIHQGNGRSAVGLWSPEALTVNIVEGSHLGDVEDVSPEAHGVRFAMDPDRLLIVDANTKIGMPDDVSGALRVFSVSTGV